MVGSIKSNIGHLEACAGLAGIIKTVECLERGEIPPQMHFINPNSNINFQRVRVPTVMVDWPSSPDGIRRAAVNTFGAGVIPPSQNPVLDWWVRAYLEGLSSLLG